MAERLGLQGVVQFWLLLYKIPPSPPLRKGGEEEVPFRKGGVFEDPFAEGGRKG